MIVRSLPLVLALALFSCGPPAKAPVAAARPLSAWSGEEAQLFADDIDAGALPASAVAPSRDEENEAKIPRRLDLADGIIGAKIIGVNAETRGEANLYRIDFAVEGLPYAGKTLESPFTLVALPGTSTYAAFKSGGGQLMGRHVIVFFKRYAPAEEGDGPVTHFHIAPMTVAAAKAIDTAKTRKQFD